MGIAIIIGLLCTFAVTKITPLQYKRHMGRAGTVIVYPPAVQNGVGFPVAPDGTAISTSGTTTSGILEGYNYALAHGYAFRIEGGDDLQPGCGHSGPGPGPGCSSVVYEITTSGTAPGITFGPTQGMEFTTGPITLNCTGATTGPCVLIDSQEMAVFDWRGMQIVGGGSGDCLVFAPTGNTPLDNVQGIIPFRFYMTSIACGTNANQSAVTFNVNNGIVNAFFYFDEINGGDMGIRILPSASEFSGNIITCKFIHGQSGSNPIVFMGIDSSHGNNANIFNNEWHLLVYSPASGKRIYDLFGNHETIFAAFRNMPSSIASNFLFESGTGYNSDFNQIFASEAGSGTGPLCSSCANVAHNRIYVAHTPANLNVSPGASPWVYQNLDMQDEKIAVTGGTVSAIAISGDASTYADTGATSGVWVLRPGEALKVTYSVAPTVTKIL